MTQPTITVSLGQLTGWQLGVAGASELGVTTTLAEYVYTPITSRVMDFSIRRGRQHELDRIEAGTASLTLINQDGAFTPSNTSSVYYPDIRPMVPIKIQATFDPFPSVAGLMARYDFSDAATLFTDTARTTPVTADGDSIRGVTDKSGNALHLSSATNPPLYKTGVNGINGNSVALADGINDILTSVTTSTTAQPLTFIAVAKHASGTGAQQALFLDNDSAPQLYQHSTGVWSYFAGTEVPSTVDVDTNAHILVGLFNGASSKLYVDGGAAAASGNPGTSGIGTQQLQWFSDGVNPWNGRGAEGLVYTSALSLADINLLGTYLGTKWGITWTTAT